MFGLVRKNRTAKRWVQGAGGAGGAGGKRWQAEICLASGTDPQAPRLMVIFRDPTRVSGDRYTLLPPGSPKDPRAAAETLPESVFADLLARSTPM